MGIGGRGEGKVGQREDRAALRETHGIEMPGLHRHARHRPTRRHGNEFDAAVLGEGVALQEFLQCFHGVTLQQNRFAARSEARSARPDQVPIGARARASRSLALRASIR